MEDPLSPYAHLWDGHTGSSSPGTCCPQRLVPIPPGISAQDSAHRSPKELLGRAIRGWDKGRLAVWKVMILFSKCSNFKTVPVMIHVAFMQWPCLCVQGSRGHTCCCTCSRSLVSPHTEVALMTGASLSADCGPVLSRAHYVPEHSVSQWPCKPGLPDFTERLQDPSEDVVSWSVQSS